MIRDPNVWRPVVAHSQGFLDCCQDGHGVPLGDGSEDQEWLGLIWVSPKVAHPAVGNPELLPISVTFEVKRPVGCERRFGTRARVVPMMFLLLARVSSGQLKPVMRGKGCPLQRV